jgi:hypothetical protein
MSGYPTNRELLDSGSVRRYNPCRKSNRILPMHSALPLLVGSGVAALGFLVMRNPMRLAFLAPGQEGYYQRMVLDRFQRHQMRMLGMVSSFFGLVIFTNGLSVLLRFKVLDAVSLGMLALLWISFIATFGFGVIYLIIQVIRGRWKEALIFSVRKWRQEIALGPIAVDPAITPRMHKETVVFTVVYCLLASLPFVIALVGR